MRINQLPKLILMLFTLLVTLGCQQQSTTESKKAHSGKYKVLATTSILGDALKNILGDLAEVQSLMGPGVDPHLYKATQNDLNLINEADIVAFHGLHLEGKMIELFEKLAKTKRILNVGDSLAPVTDALIPTTEFGGSYDPHIWLSVPLWSQAIEVLSKSLQQAMPEHQATLIANTNAYLTQLKALDDAIKAKLVDVPESQRVLVTAHDAFSYFSKTYRFEVRSLQGLSTIAEYGLKDVTELVNYIMQKRINTVFLETIVPSKSIEAVIEGCKAKGHTVKIGGTLYSDALGESNGPAGTYIGMINANVDLIFNALPLAQ